MHGFNALLVRKIKSSVRRVELVDSLVELCLSFWEARAAVRPGISFQGIEFAVVRVLFVVAIFGVSELDFIRVVPGVWLVQDLLLLGDR